MSARLSLLAFLIVVALLYLLVGFTFGFVAGRAFAASRAGQPTLRDTVEESAQLRWPDLGAAALEAPRQTATAEPTPAPSRGAVSPAAPRLFGLATWWASFGPGDYAAAGPALRRAMGDYLGRWVTVCASTCVRAKLVTSCACRGDRVIDLAASLFARLAPLSRGVVQVRVSW